MRCALALVLVAACGRATTPPQQLPAIPRDAPPGTRWITPILPWHLSQGAGGVIVAGNVALVAGSEGVIEEIDLSTGARLRGHALDKPLHVQSFVRLSDGRYLLAGEIGDETHAAILDPTTFAASWFALERLPFDKESYASASALELADHGIVIGGIDLPLAIYDPKTLTRTRVLQEQATWTDLAVSSTAVYARHGVSGMIEIDLASGKTTTPTTSLMAAARDTRVERTYEKGQVKFRVVTGTASHELPATLGFTASLDEEGARIASLRTGVVTVYAAADGSVLGRFDLSPQTTFGAKLVFAGDRLVIATGSTLRVADLVTKSLTSVPEPYGPYMQLAVDSGGTITAIGSEVWRFQDGRLISTASLGKQTALVDGNPLRRFATRTARPIEPGISRGKFPSVITVKTPEGRPIREVILPRETDNAWIGDEGKLIASYRWEVDQPQKLVRAQGSKLYDIVAYNMDAMIDDIDVDGGIAAFSLGGTTTLLDTTTGAKTHEVYNPNCAELGVSELERHGDRILATDDKDAIVYDRTTGRAIGSARFPSTIDSNTFIPDEDQILIRLDDRLLLWEPATNATRELSFRDAVDIRVSPDRRHAVFALRDGRLALVDFAALRAAMKQGVTLPKIDVPTSCSERDPFDLRDPADEDDQTGDIDEDHEDPEDPEDYEDLDEEDTGD